MARTTKKTGPTQEEANEKMVALLIAFEAARQAADEVLALPRQLLAEDWWREEIRCAEYLLRRWHTDMHNNAPLDVSNAYDAEHGEPWEQGLARHCMGQPVSPAQQQALNAMMASMETENACRS
jgi:hypothetical protein